MGFPLLHTSPTESLAIPAAHLPARPAESFEAMLQIQERVQKDGLRDLAAAVKSAAALCPCRPGRPRRRGAPQRPAAPHRSALRAERGHAQQSFLLEATLF
eukprot:scaffold109_cov252-Pinguiococcus_pyrenoidosus.AAC.45